MAKSNHKRIQLPTLVKDGTKLISGNVWGQAIAFLAYLILTRLYSPDDFTLYSLFYSYIEVFIILSTCKYELAIVAVGSEQEAAALTRLSLRLNAIVSIALLCLVTLLCIFPVGGSLHWVSEHPLIALLIPPMVFLCGTTRVYSFLFNRAKSFGQIALSEVVTSTTAVISKVLMGLSQSLHLIGMPLGTVIGKAAGNINYLYHLRKLSLPINISRQEIKQAARQHSNYPRFTMPKELINSFSYNLPFLWLASYFNHTEIGLFSLALTISLRPINLFNTAFEKLLYVRLAEKVRSRQSIATDVYRFLLYVNLVALPLFIVAFFIAEPLVVFLFGNKWEGCGTFVQYLLPWVFFMLSATSLMFLSNIFSRQRTEFWFYVVLLILRVVSLGVGLAQNSFHLAILLFAASGAVINLALLLWQLSLVRHYEKTL